MPEITGIYTGDADIISYVLILHHAEDNSIPDNTELTDTTTYLVDSSSERIITVPVDTAGSLYYFKYKVENAHGWSEVSGIETVQAATTPNAPTASATPISLSTDNLSVVVSWAFSEADKQGSEIL